MLKISKSQLGLAPIMIVLIGGATEQKIRISLIEKFFRGHEIKKCKANFLLGYRRSDSGGERRGGSV